MGPNAVPLVSPSTPAKQTDDAIIDPSSDAPVLKPVLDSFQLSSLKNDLAEFGTLGSQDSLIGMNRFRTNDGTFKGLERKLRKLGESLPTLQGDELKDAVKEIQHLEGIERALFQLSQLKIKDPYVNDMRRVCATNLLSDVGNPLGAKTYEEGVKMFASLHRFAGSEDSTAKAREAMRQMLAPLYPGGLDSGYVFALNSYDARKLEEDSTRRPDESTFDNLEVIRVYNNFKESSDPDDQKTARAVEVLFAYLKDENAHGSTSDPMLANAWSLNDLMDRRRAILNDPALKPFFTSFQDIKKQKAEFDPDLKIAADLSGSMQLLGYFQNTTDLFYHFENVTAKAPLDKACDALLQDCENLIAKGPEYVLYLKEKGQYDLASALQERLDDDLLAHRSILQGLKGKDLTAEALKTSAVSLAPMVSIFRGAQEMKVQEALSAKLFRVSTVGVGDLHEKLAEITQENIPDPKERFAAYQKISAEADKRSIVFVVEGRVKQLQEMKKPVVSFFDIFQGAGAWVAPEASIGGGGRAYREVVVSPRLQQYDDMAAAYRKAADLVKSDDPAEVQKGLHDFQRLEAAMDASGLKDLQEGAEDAATANQVIMVAVIVLASLALAEAAPALGVGARALTAFLPVELGTQRLVATGLTYAASGLLITAAQREVTGILMPDADQGNFLEQWVLNTAMMGVGAVGAKAGQGVFAKGLEWLAERRIAARTGTEIVTVGSTTGKAIETSVLEAEKESILQGLTARFSKVATVFGAEYTSIQVFEYVKAVGQLSARGAKDPEGAAFDHVFSLKSQGMMAGFMVLMKAHGMTSVSEVDPAITDAAMKVEYQAIARSLNRELPAFQAELEAAGIQEPSDLLGHPELLQKAKTLFGHQADLLAFKVKLDPTDIDAVGNWEAAAKIRNTSDQAFQFIDGVEASFGEGNAFGVKPLNPDHEVTPTSYTYDNAKFADLRGKLSKIPGARVRVSPANKLIEVEFPPTDLTPGGSTVRLVPESLSP